MLGGDVFATLRISRQYCQHSTKLSFGEYTITNEVPYVSIIKKSHHTDKEVTLNSRVHRLVPDRLALRLSYDKVTYISTLSH